MPVRPHILDLFCGAGGAGMGYRRAGFQVTGVDIKPQPRYPFPFIQADVLSLDPAFLALFDAVHASPPCQKFTLASRIRGNEHPDFVNAVRLMLMAAGRPWVIENVEGAPLFEPVTLCGLMFPGLRVYRHRLFEAPFPIQTPAHGRHTVPLTKMGRAVPDGSFMHVVGNFNGAETGRRAMGCPWMTRDGLREAIPPAYTRHVGLHIREILG